MAVGKTYGNIQLGFVMRISAAENTRIIIKRKNRRFGFSYSSKFHDFKSVRMVLTEKVLGF